MKTYLFAFLILLAVLTGCNWGSLSNKNLSKSNIAFVELSFPKKANRNKSVRLDSSHLALFAEILNSRKEGFFKPTNCYIIHIQLRDGGEVNYLTDGINFQGFDDSSDLPFSFKTQTDILKAVFNLQKIDSCE